MYVPLLRLRLWPIGLASNAVRCVQRERPSPGSHLCNVSVGEGEMVHRRCMFCFICAVFVARCIVWQTSPEWQRTC